MLTRTDSSQSAREERGCRTDKNETIKKTENAIPTGAASHTRAHRMDRKNSASCTKYREKRARRNEKNSQNEKKKKVKKRDWRHIYIVEHGTFRRNVEFC